MTLRILSGKFKNHLIKTPKSQRTRPTSSLVRKAVFDILQEEIKDAQFLDICAGSGAMGFEALSHGASHATFIEMDKNVIKVLKENIEHLKVKEHSDLLVMDAQHALKYLSRHKKDFDLIYLDPPYQADPRIYVEWIDTHLLLRKGGKLLLEQGLPILHDVTKQTFIHLKHVDQRRFGKTILHQFIRVD